MGSDALMIMGLVARDGCMCHHPDSSVCTEYVGVPWKSCLEQSYHPWLHIFQILPSAEPEWVSELLEGPPTRPGAEGDLGCPEKDMCCPAEVTSYILGPIAPQP